METVKRTDCPPEEVLLGFADGTLEAGREREDVEAHLAECERCLSVVASLAASARRLTGAVLETPPLELERRVEGRPLPEPRETRASSFLGRLAAV